MMIYRVKAASGCFVGKWHTTRKGAQAHKRRLENDEITVLMFGKDYVIEAAELMID